MDLDSTKTKFYTSHRAVNFEPAKKHSTYTELKKKWKKKEVRQFRKSQEDIDTQKLDKNKPIINW